LYDVFQGCHSIQASVWTLMLPNQNRVNLGQSWATQGKFGGINIHVVWLQQLK